ncbi:MAG: zf-HC2 domain-containing protein, partial [bacterium]
MEDTAPHPGEDELQAFAAGTGVPEDREALERHLADCAECRHVVALAVTPSIDPGAEPGAEVFAGALQGRYL